MRCAIIIIAVLATLCPAAPARAQETLTQKVKRLEAEVTALRGRIAELEATLAAKNEPASKTRIEILDDAEGEPAGPALNQPLDEAQSAAVAAATDKVDALAADVRQHEAKVSALPKASRDATLARWADASKELAELYAQYGQESACLTALAKFRAWKDKSYGSQRTFDAAAYSCAETLAGQWKEPASAMRFAVRYGPESQTKAAAWAKLCESAAEATGKRAYKALALKCYLRAAVVGNDQGAWRHVRRLEAELKTKN